MDKDDESRKTSRHSQHHISEETIASGKWLALNKITYTDGNNQQRQWESMHRTTKQSNSSSDAVFVIAFLRRLLKYDCLVLVKQYRPPVKAYSIEFPAGLLDAGETATVAAIRELKEETGYTGVVGHCSPAVCCDGGASDTTCNLVTVEIDGDDPINAHPTPTPEETEFIEILKVPLDELLDKLNEYSAEGLIVHGMLYSYAISMEQTRRRQPNYRKEYTRTINK